MGELFAGRFELLDPIADGGMGSVWRVRDHRDGEVRAAKLLRQVDASSLLRFMREQSTRIHHPHVVTPLSWAGEDDRILFTMPLVRGGSVASLVGDHGPLPEAWVVVILDQLLSALEAVHAAGVVHRDVKPANILLEPTGSAPPYSRLSDFGIAAPLGQPRLTGTSVVIGTPGYMAPEQAQGADPDPRQDVYAAGTVGLEMLVGRRPPFGADAIPDTPLAHLLDSARAADPADRPTTAELRRALAPFRPGAWDPGDVEVLDHLALPEPPAGPPSPGALSPDTRRATSARAPGPRRKGDRPGLLLPALMAAGGILLVVAALLLLL